MIPIWKNTVKGYDLFLDEQKKVEGEAVYSLRVFDTIQQIIYDFVPATQATSIPTDLHPRGSTALNDAVCMQIERIDKYKMENPEFTKVVLLIMTDGEENMSKKFSTKKLNSTVAKRVQDGWQVTLMGTNIEHSRRGQKWAFKMSFSTITNLCKMPTSMLRKLRTLTVATIGASHPASI